MTARIDEAVERVLRLIEERPDQNLLNVYEYQYCEAHYGE
jgi:hypothetical protein